MHMYVCVHQLIIITQSNREWFRYSCLSSKEASLPTTINESMFQSLLALLNKPESILVIASRYYVAMLIYVCVTFDL